MAQMATAAGIKVIVGTIPLYGGSNLTPAFTNSLLFDRGLRQEESSAALPGTLFTNPNVVLVDYQMAGAYAPMTSVAEDMIGMFGFTLESSYLGTSGNINTVPIGGMVQFTAYGVFSNGSTQALSPYIYYDGCYFSSNNKAVMQIDETTGLATAGSPGQAWISAQCGGVELSPWVMTVP